MSYIQPSTRVKLIRNIHNTSDNKHTLYFASLADQTTFYESATGITFTDFSFQRGTNGVDRVRVGASYGSLYGCSYMLFNNEAFLNKNFYAFITDIKYVNNETCDVYYKIDDLQTWLFDINVLPSYMERTHSSDDSGDLFVDEGLSPGEMECTYDLTTELTDYPIVSVKEGECRARYCVLIAATMDLAESSASSNPYPVHGEDAQNYKLGKIWYRDGVILDSVGLFAVPINIDTDTAGKTGGDYFLAVYNFIYGNGFTDYIVDMWTYPMCFLDFELANTGGSSPVDAPYPTCVYVKGVTSDANVIEMNLPRNPMNIPDRTIHGYLPKNKKLFTYPFTQLIVSNNNGSAVDYRFEWFTSADPTLRLFGTTTPEAKVRAVPYNYGEGAVSNVYDTSYAIDTAPYPSVCYTNDAYEVWLAQNRNTIENNFDINKRNFVTGQIMTGLNTTLGLLTGGLGKTGSAVSAVESSFLQTQNALNNMDSIIANAEDMRQRPPTASGIQSVGLAQQNKKIGFTANVVHPSYARTRELDDYFTMYGYAQKRVMPVNMHVRSEFTYIKTTDCNIQSSIPKDIERHIADIFNSGVWFWVNNNHMCDFTVNNAILS